MTENTKRVVSSALDTMLLALRMELALPEATIDELLAMAEVEGDPAETVLRAMSVISKEV